MKLTDLQALIAKRKLALAFTVTGEPFLRGNKEQMTPSLLRYLKLRRDEIIAKLRPADPPPFCRWCGKPVDEKGRCWAKKCFSRPCEGCGRNTGSAFIANCFPCGEKLK